jgi:S1-C subfamily serine protease
VRRKAAQITLRVEIDLLPPEAGDWCRARLVEIRWGIELLALDMRSAYEHEAPSERGLYVLAVRRASPAARAGLQAGDVIRRCADREVRELADFPADETRIPLWVMRGARVLELELHGE